MLIDAHLHCTGKETTSGVLRTLDDAAVDVGVLRTLDDAAVDVGVLLAPFLLDDGRSFADASGWRAGNAHLARLVRGAADRLVGFAFVDPSVPGAAQELRRAVDAGLAGAKMVPSGWYPYDDAVQPVFEEAAALELPLLFHSGIFIDGRSGRYCRPVHFEALRAHPGVRVALAHLGWPWTDEAIAVGLVDRIHGVPDARAAFRFDLSFGAPPPYRLDVLQRALEVLGAGLLQFGSDCFLPCDGARIAERYVWLAELMDRLELPAADRAQIRAGTAAAWLGRGAGTPPAAQRAQAAAPAHDPQPVTDGGGWLLGGRRYARWCC